MIIIKRTHFFNIPLNVFGAGKDDNAYEINIWIFQIIKISMDITEASVVVSNPFIIYKLEVQGESSVFPEYASKLIFKIFCWIKCIFVFIYVSFLFMFVAEIGKKMSGLKIEFFQFSVLSNKARSQHNTDDLFKF